MQLKSADFFCWKATLQTSPSSGQATTNPQLRHLKLPACHSGAALGLSGRGGGKSQPENSAIMGLISTLEEIEAAVQQLPPAKRAEFRAWFLSFDAADWDQQMEDDLTAGNRAA